MSLYVMTPPEWWLAISHRTTSAFLPGTRKSIAWPEACFEGVLVPSMTAPGRQVETISTLPKWLRIRPSRLRVADVRHVVEVPAEPPACRWLVLV